MGSIPTSPIFLVWMRKPPVRTNNQKGSNIEKEVILDLVSQIVEKLKQMNIEVFDHYQMENQDGFVILGEKIIIHYNLKEETITVSFHVSVRPELVARVVLSLNKLTVVIKVAESFWYDKDRLISGKDAYEKFEESRTQGIIQDFVKTQQELHFLFSAECYRV